MANNLLGTGKSTGMFYVAPKGTALPATPGTTPGADWKLVGDISEDGITLTLPSGDVIKNWAKEPVRKVNTETGKVAGAIIETSKTVFETLFGAENVDYEAATSSHGNISSVELSPDVAAAPAAYLFLAKDGDVLTMYGTTNGLIEDIADVAVSPDGIVSWNVTIGGTWKIAHDDGQVTS